MNTYERIYNLLTEGPLSKEVRLEPGNTMAQARGQIGSGLYAARGGDKPAARKHGKKAAKLIAKNRQRKANIKTGRDRAWAWAQGTSR